MQCSYERLQSWSSDVASTLVAFCLDENPIETSRILPDHAVDPAISALTELVSSISSRTTVTHCLEQFYYQRFEPCGQHFAHGG